MTTNRKKILLPNNLARAGWDQLQGRDDIEAVSFSNTIKPEELRAALGDAVGIALSATPFTAAELDAAPKLEVVARVGVGYDAVEVPALTRRRVPLFVSGTANSVSVAEKAMFLMLTLAKRGAMMDALVREGRWWDKFKDVPVDLWQKTVLVVGFGRIGTRTAKRCLGMEMKVVVYDPYVSADAIRAAGYEPASDLDAALARADFVTIHCPKTKETVGLINAARLQRMKPTAILVNTARGGIIDEPALEAALKTGQIAGAGIDVFAKEPAAVDHPLLKLPNVVVAPHVAGVTVESRDRMAITTVQNILSMLDGKPIRENVINKEVLD
ncbi:MAG TPA: hydroxyacid dehydrogenase [Stellaceae bacterium]|nr:hydroxyacid dehydrogenase [Stellaceae bacterium]